MSDPKENLRQTAISYGGQSWGLLADAFDDQEFRKLLTDQEANVLNQTINNPGILSSYKHIFPDIVAKYLAWILYTQGKVADLKQEVIRHIKKYKQLEQRIEESEVQLNAIRESAKYISGATALVEYSKAFEVAAKKHEENAKKEFKNYMYSLLGFATVVAFTFFFSIAEFPELKRMVADDIRSMPLSTGILVIKAFFLLFAYQISLFFRKNYGAEKHLQEVYQHRSDVLQSLHAVYEALKDNAEERAKILSAGALFAYERGETGYITTKEGAGSGDSFLEGIFGKIFNR